MNEPDIRLDWRLSDICKFFGVSRQTIHRWMNLSENPLPHYRPAGGTLRFSSKEAIDWARVSHPSDN